MKKEARAMEKAILANIPTANMRKVRPRARPGLSCQPYRQPGGQAS